MRPRAYYLGKDGVEIGFKIGGFMGARIQNGMLNLGGKRFILRPERFYRRSYRPFFPWLGLKKIEFLAIDYRYDSPEPVLKHDMPKRIMATKKENGDTENIEVPVAIPGQLSPEVIGAYLDSKVIKDLHKKEFDVKTILLLFFGLIIVVMAISGLS